MFVAFMISATVVHGRDQKVLSQTHKTKNSKSGEIANPQDKKNRKTTSVKKKNETQRVKIIKLRQYSESNDEKSQKGLSKKQISK